MAKTTIIRFIHSGGNTDFYSTEVDELIVKTVQDRVLHQSIDNFFTQTILGEAYKVFNLKYYLGSTSTLNRLNNLYDKVGTYGQPELMRFYYKYNLDADEFAWVQMIRQGFIKHYFNGLYQAVNLPITFVEVVPEPVEITLPTFMALEKGVGVTVSDKIIVGV